MTSDLQILLVITSAIALVQTALFLALSRIDRRNRVLQVWGLGLLLLALGYAGLALRGTLPNVISIVLANTLLTAAFIPFYAAIRMVRGLGVPRFDAFGWIITLAVAIACGWFSIAYPDLAVRIIAIQLAVAILSGRMAMEFTLHSRSPLGTLPAHILAALAWFVCVRSSITVILTGAQGERTQDMFQAGPPTSIFFANAPLVMLVLPLVLLWMHYQIRNTSGAGALSHHRTRAAAGLQAFLIRCDAAILGGQTPVSVASIDIDNFKQINRQHGFQAACAMLDWTESLIRQHMRETDDIELAGLDHFILTMPETDQDTAMTLAEGIRREVEMGTFQYEKHSMQTTVSIGVVMQSATRPTARALHVSTKLAIDSARAAGRNRVELAPLGFHVADADRF